MPRLNMKVMKTNVSKDQMMLAAAANKPNLRPFHKNKQHGVSKKIDHSAMIASFFNTSSSAAQTSANTSHARNVVVSIDPEEGKADSDEEFDCGV